MTEDQDRAVFEAAFPAIQSAIKIYGDRQGMRVQLDVPESEMGEATKLLLWRERVLRITVEPVSKSEDDEWIARATARTQKRR